jgi:hypothetical protein
VKLHFIGEFLIEAAAVEQVLEAAEELFHGFSLGGAEDGADGGVDSFVFRKFGFKVALAGGREFVEADLAVGFGNAPFGVGPTIEEDFLKGRIESAFFDLQDFGGEVMNALGNGVTVEMARAEHAED